MSYNLHRSSDMWAFICSILLVIAIWIGSSVLLNSCTATTWNEGICPNCEVRYELRGASRGTKYYSCPECGGEVTRY